MGFLDRLRSAFGGEPPGLPSFIGQPPTPEPFVLRAHARGELRVSLGTLVEAGDLRLYRSPFAADELELHDDTGRGIVVPAGQLLVVRVFEGVVHRALEHHADGAVVAVEVPVDHPFWIVGAPAWEACEELGDGRRQLPRRERPYEITTREPPTGHDFSAMQISHTMDLTLPASMLALGHPQHWMCAPRGDHPMVCIAQINAPGGCVRSSVLDDGARYLQDAVWRYTTATAVSGSVRPSAQTFDDLATWRPRFPSDTIFVWGSGETRDDRLTLYIRSAADAVEQRMTGTLFEVRRALVDALVARGIGRAPARTPVCAALGEWGEQHHHQGTFVIHNVLNVAVSNKMWDETRMPLYIGSAGSSLDRIKKCAEQAPSTLTKLMWIVAAIHAHQVDQLERGTRNVVLASISKATGDDPLHRLEPGILLGLGLADAAREACRSARLECAGKDDPSWTAYGEWLDSIERGATG